MKCTRCGSKNVEIKQDLILLNDYVSCKMCWYSYPLTKEENDNLINFTENKLVFNEIRPNE